MTTALVGDFPLGIQPLWPPAPINLADFFDRPPWERPTRDRGYEPPRVPDVFTGGSGVISGYTPPSGDSPGFGGGANTGSIYSNSDYGGRNGGTVVVATPTGQVISLVIMASRRTFYRIEVYDETGERLSAVPTITEGKLTRRLDTASTLEFTVPLGAEGASDLVRPNVVWLRDRWGFVIDTFQIQRRRPMGRGDASYFEIVCQGSIAQLGGEVVLEYNGDAAGATVLDHVTALVNLQLRGNAITLGEIEQEIGEIQLPFFAVDTNIHAALLQLQAALPQAYRGRIYVDPQRRLQWRLAPGDTGEQVITRGRNIYNIEAETDYTSLVNVIYMYGEGQDPATRLKLTDAGEAAEYLEDAASVATWGLSPAIKVDRRIRHADTLLRVAQRILEEFGDPQVTVRLDMLDLAKADDAPDGWEDIDIGGQYRVVDTALSVDTVVEIVGIETDLSRPVPVRVDLANQTRTLSDLISALVDALQQPLDVDGERYPTMGRNYSAAAARQERAGDVRWNDGDDRGEMHDGSGWRELAGAVDEYHYTATTKGGLTAASGVPVASVAKVDGVGTDNGMFCVVNPAKNGWAALNFFE